MSHNDAITALLKAPLKDNVYVEQSYTFTNGNPWHECRLLRATSGLNQSPREWFETLKGLLQTIGFERLCKDQSILAHKGRAIIGIYADDILILGPSTFWIIELMANFVTRFRMKYRSNVSYCVGVSTTRDQKNRTIWIDRTGLSKATDRPIEFGRLQYCLNPNGVRHWVKGKPRRLFCKWGRHRCLPIVGGSAAMVGRHDQARSCPRSRKMRKVVYKSYFWASQRC